MTKLHHALLSACVLLGMAFSSQAQEWTPQLQAAAQGEFRDPMESFRIHIPASLPMSVLQTLALELDNIDVTAMVSRQGEIAEFTPVQPLPWGKHVLRLVEYAEDGSIVERGHWEFQVRRSAVFREIDYAADINLIASQRIADENLDAGGAKEPDGFTGQGSAAFQGRVADDDWEATGQMDLIYNSEKEQTSNDRQLDLGEYLFTGNMPSAQTRLNLGDHSLSQTSLVMEGFHRRGLSGSVGISALNSSVSAFAMRSEPVAGFQQGLGIGDRDNRVDGVVWETQPFQDHPEQLYLSATYLSGASNQSGEAVGAAQADQAGKAWSLLADSTLLDQQVRLRGEVAGTNVDSITADTGDQDLINKDGNGVSFSATYTPQPTSPDSRMFWNTGVEYSKIDTYFISLANPNLPSDKELNRVFVNADWSGLSAQLSAARETDNVDNIDTLPRIETKLSQLALNYSLTEAPAEGSWLHTIGTPSLTLQFSNSTQKQIKAVLDNFGLPVYQDLDITNDTSMFGASFNKQSWSWGWSYSASEQQDKINPNQDQITYSRELNANIQFNDSIVVIPALQSQTTQLTFDGSTSDTDIYNLGSQFLFTDTLNGQINLSQSHSSSNSPGFPQEVDTGTLNLQLTWNWILPKNSSPGFDISLSGSYQDTDDRIDDINDLKTYQVFLSLVMKLPISSAE